MKYPAFVIAAAAALAVSALATGPAVAQESSATPTPPTMTDTGPPPASERNSMGAIVLMDEPVLAQREYLEMLARQGLDTRIMGGAPSQIIRKTQTKDDVRKQRALDEAMKRRGEKAP